MKYIEAELANSLTMVSLFFLIKNLKSQNKDVKS